MRDVFKSFNALIALRIYMEHKYVYTLVGLVIIGIITAVILKLKLNTESNKNYS